MLEILFWILFGIVVYTFAGYAILLSILVFFKKKLGFGRKTVAAVDDTLPKVCLFVTAFNELDFLDVKVKKIFFAPIIQKNGV